MWGAMVTLDPVHLHGPMEEKESPGFGQELKIPSSVIAFSSKIAFAWSSITDGWPKARCFQRAPTSRPLSNGRP